MPVYIESYLGVMLKVNRHSGVFHSRAHLTCFRNPLSNIVISVLAGNGGLQQAATVICFLQSF